eukprot:Mycagemm_TRINITY_DN10317_c2_g1::TRINITY_DN10317_c2_g1_i9::g.854::m.854 type:complete len:128 gc:universal TRINITY_DN10317_c2_g1_i9:387-4(-)
MSSSPPSAGSGSFFFSSFFSSFLPAAGFLSSPLAGAAPPAAGAAAAETVLSLAWPLAMISSRFLPFSSSTSFLTWAASPSMPTEERMAKTAFSSGCLPLRAARRYAATSFILGVYGSRSAVEARTLR